MKPISDPYDPDILIAKKMLENLVITINPEGNTLDCPCCKCTGEVDGETCDNCNGDGYRVVPFEG